VAVLSNVLQNGDPRWSAATDIAQLIEPPPGKLRDYTPQLRYLLLDEGAIDESAPLALRNLTAALLRLEKSRDSGNVSARKQIASRHGRFLRSRQHTLMQTQNTIEFDAPGAPVGKCQH
jgi:hypothetical protein